jgi:hypothetical protein
MFESKLAQTFRGFSQTLGVNFNVYNVLTWSMSYSTCNSYPVVLNCTLNKDGAIETAVRSWDRGSVQSFVSFTLLHIVKEARRINSPKLI